MRQLDTKSVVQGTSLQRSPGAVLGNKLLLKAVSWAIPQQTLLKRGPSQRGEIALTFDDGPDPEGTARILDILRAAKVRATFFLIGEHALQQPEMVRRIVAEGHSIGNHTKSHRVLTELAKHDWVNEIESGERILETLSGTRSRLFRPPKGETSVAILRYLARKNKTTVLWSTDPKDFATDDEDCLWTKLEQNRFQGGEIILFHDRIRATAAVLPRLIEKLGKSGLRFNTVEDMIG